MSIIAIANITNGHKTIGFRLLEIEKRKVMDADLKSIFIALTNKKATIDNLSIIRGDICGSNGSIDRLPTIINGKLVGKSPIIIINQIDESGYTVSDYNGQILKLNNNEVIKYAKEQGISNGKVVDKNGELFISSIKGEYPKVSSINQTVQAKNEISETIVNNKIVKFIYDTGNEQIAAKTREKATIQFENWINSNTKYRGLGMYAKHHGYNLILEDAYGNRYMQNGMRTYKVDQYANIIEEVSSSTKSEQPKVDKPAKKTYGILKGISVKAGEYDEDSSESIELVIYTIASFEEIQKKFGSLYFTDNARQKLQIDGRVNITVRFDWRQKSELYKLNIPLYLNYTLRYENHNDYEPGYNFFIELNGPDFKPNKDGYWCGSCANGRTLESEIERLKHGHKYIGNM